MDNVALADIREHYVVGELPQVLERSAKYFMLDPESNTYKIFIVSQSGDPIESGYATKEELQNVAGSNEWRSTQW